MSLGNNFLKGLTIRFTFRGNEGSEYLDYTTTSSTLKSLTVEEFKKIINDIEKGITAYYQRDRVDDIDQSRTLREVEEFKFDEEYNPKSDANDSNSSDLHSDLD
jgi:hypothetical protein